MKKFFPLMALITLFLMAGAPLALALGQSCVNSNSTDTLPEGQERCVTIFSIDLNCSPSSPPNKGGCGFPAVITLIKGLIDLGLKTVVIPLASLMFIWAGYVIITAGGDPAKVQKGRTVITTALVGIVITLLAGLIVGFIAKLLT